MYDVLTTMPGTEGIMYKHLLSILAHVVITKCHRLGDLSKNHFLLIVLETEESKMRVPADLMTGEGPLLGLQTAVFSLYPHMAESRERAGSPVSSQEGANPFTMAPPSGPHHSPRLTITNR